MSSIFDPSSLAALEQRLGRLKPDTPRRFGTLTANEMLCHLADATDWAQGRKSVEGLTYPSTVHWSKWVALYLPVPWPKGIPTRPAFDPKRSGTKPHEFERDRARAVESMRAMATAPAGSLVPAHMVFGPMTNRDWGRWAYRHADHHLRQFGV